MKQKRYLLVYQGGIANVFEVDCFNLAAGQRKSKRIIQDSFVACEWVALGLAHGGHLVASVGCNQAGDIIDAKYTEYLDSLPFHDAMCPVNQRKTNGEPHIVRELYYSAIEDTSVFANNKP